MNKIGIIGRVAKGANLHDGQTIKTKILYNELKRIYNTSEVFVADTYNCKKNMIKLFFDVFKCIRNSEVVFVLLSRNGAKILFPFIYYCNKFFKRKIYHDVIGGALDELIRCGIVKRRHLLGFEINWVESNSLKKKLEELDISNVKVLPNFKRLEILDKSLIDFQSDEIINFCTFSRVTKQKGITEAINAIRYVNDEYGTVRLHIYGPIEDSYKEEFNKLLNDNSDCVIYKGVIEFSKSVDVLKNYFMLLFPTTFYGEGFPGTLIDAYAAGLPIIATDWHCNPEIIDEGVTGFLYDSNNQSLLKDLIIYSIRNKEKIIAMKYNCIDKAWDYHPDKIMKIITNQIEKC